MTTPTHLLDTPLLAAAPHLDVPAVVGARETLTWRQVHQASVELAARLGPATAVCNLCSSRASYLVTCLAALRNRLLMILPPSGGNADLAGVLESSGAPVIVVDDPAAIQPDWPRFARCLVYEPQRHASRIPDADLAWEPAWDSTAILLYTSGSTGAPEPQPKTLRQLAIGARVLGARLSQDAGDLAGIRRIVCSVPPQHMFGLEASVMLSLVHSIPVLDRRPLLPADVQELFSTSPPAAWVATPLHLRSLAQAGVNLPNCAVVIASTMPLAPALAQQTETLVNAPVLEIYGSTETGVLAMRRTARDADWLPVDGVQVTSTSEGARASGSHFASPAELLDQIEIRDSGRFALLGRQADLVKIAGRRASLAGLNLLLQDLPGLDDGVFYMPSSGRATERLCLFYSGAGLDRAAIDRWLRARLDPVFLPRTVIRVERLPRGDNGKLARQSLDQAYEAWLAGGARASGADKP